MIKRCSICGSDFEKTISVKEEMYAIDEHFNYGLCAKCGCLECMEPPQNMSKFYPANYYSFDSGSKKNWFKDFRRGLKRKIILWHPKLITKFIYLWLGNYQIFWTYRRLTLTKGAAILDVGAGGGDNMSINVSTNLNGTNAQIDISPTGTGHVHIKPSGTGSIEVAPTNVGTIDNMTIGATTAKNASVVDLSVTGTLSFDAAQGTAGQVLTSAGTGVTPTWTTPTTGTVTSISVVSANGLAGTSSGGATPALTLSTSITGILKGNGTAISAAVANTDYMGVGAPVTKTADFTVANGEIWYINNKSGSTCTVTLPAASSWTGRTLTFKNMQAQTLVSASSNVVPIDSTVAGTAILLAVVGNWATMVSDGTNWIIMQQAANNCLLLE
jgi:hypothetical protein